jgi:hypothetical protein
LATPSKSIFSSSSSSSRRKKGLCRLVFPRVGVEDGDE